MRCPDLHRCQVSLRKSHANAVRPRNQCHLKLASTTLALKICVKFQFETGKERRRNLVRAGSLVRVLLIPVLISFNFNRLQVELGAVGRRLPGRRTRQLLVIVDGCDVVAQRQRLNGLLDSGDDGPPHPWERLAVTRSGAGAAANGMGVRSLQVGCHFVEHFRAVRHGPEMQTLENLKIRKVNYGRLVDIENKKCSVKLEKRKLAISF